jgi:putative ABC transport system permease protein
MTIVGVVRDNRMHGVDRELYPLLYWSIAQLPSSSAWLVVKARSEGTQLERRVVDEVHRIAPQVPVNGVTTMAAVKSESLWRQRFTAFMIGLFATVALVLAAAGVYGVVGYSVSRRMREMAIRVALGAKSSTILRLIVFGAVAPCVAGTVIGLALFLSTKRVLDGQLFGVPATDPTILISASALPILVGAIAGFVPARQLLRRLDPSETLRSG